MELTKNQIQEIDTYISSCGVKYYDVKAEILDHFATILEKKLEENPYIDFKQEIRNIHKSFSNKGFQKLLQAKTDATHKRFIKLTFQNLISFFKLPKIIIAVFVYFLLYKMMHFFIDKETFFQVLTVFGFIVIAQLGIRMFIYHKQKRDIFLVLNRTNLFFLIVNNMFVWFNLILSFRTDKSYLNTNYNNIHLIIFVFMMLLYWSMEYVYQQNRKQLQKQYSDIFV